MLFELRKIFCVHVAKLGGKSDQQTEITTFSDQAEKKTSLSFSVEELWLPSTTLYYSFDRDFLAPDFQNKGRLQRVFTPDQGEGIERRCY